MRLYYIDESEGPTCYVRSALGVDAERWNDLFTDIQEWRRELREGYGIPPDRELHACDLLAGRGMLARNGGANERLAPSQGAEVFMDGLRKPDVKAYEQVSLDRLLNRINASVKAAGRHAFLIFDEGKERMITRAYRRLRIFNPVPSRYERWEEGERTRNIPVENVIGGPAFRSSDSDHLLQMADIVAHVTHVPTGSQLVLDPEGEIIDRHNGRDDGPDRLDAVLADQTTVDRIVEGLQGDDDLRPR